MDPTSTGIPASTTDDPFLQVRLVARSRAAFIQAVDSVEIDFGCAGPRVHPGGEVTASVLVRSAAIDQLRQRSELIRVEVVGDFSANQAREVGTGNRFANPGTLPEGLGVLLHKDRP
jgi:hypothetical protein